MSPALSLSVPTCGAGICPAPGDVRSSGSGCHWRAVGVGASRGAGLDLGPERSSAMGSVRAVGLLLGVLGGALCGPHSLRYFLIGVSEPSPGVPEFMSVGYVDGNLIVRYDSETRRLVPQVDWMAANLDQEYWDRESSKLQRHQQMNRVNMETLRSRYNQSRGAHTMQRMIGCDLLEDGGTRGYYQHAYDGRDFIALDMDTMTFTAVDAGAQITKRKWEDGTVAEQQKHYVEKICVESLKKYVSYGRAVLERKERPTVQVSGKEGAGFLTLQCRAYGFYPRAITVSWLKDGEVRDQETERGSVVPNSDGTYYTWASIDARPGEKDKYRCRVEHASLPEAEVYAWETGSNWLAISVCVAVLAVVAICGVIRWKKSGNYGVAAQRGALTPWLKGTSPDGCQRGQHVAGCSP